MLGLFVFSALVRNADNSPRPENLQVAGDSNEPLSSNESVVQSGPDDEYIEALGKIWVEQDETRIHGYTIKRRCGLGVDQIDSCTLTIKHKGKIVVKLENERGEKDMLRYGFFNFLGKHDEQLVVHTYSGGSHCCYDYYIYDLSPRFHPLYESSKFDSANEIGNDLFPVDIDGDGIFEFYQDVMAFDYMGFAGHASATFPPAIFAYNKTSKRFALSDKRFSHFILGRMQENLGGFEKWQREHNQRNKGTANQNLITDDEVNEVAVREKFLYMVYAGKRDEGWKYFIENYKTASGKGYQDEFREKFTTDFRERFSNDPTYKSIYRR